MLKLLDKIKIFFFIDNWIGVQVIKYLREQQEEIIGIAVHSPEKQNYIDDIIKYSGLPEEEIYTINKSIQFRQGELH